MAAVPMPLPIDLPELPSIPSDEIRTQVFAHSTSLTFSGTATEQPQSNERLEFLGDSYLNFCISQVIYNEFPDLTPGELSELRSGIVSNANLNLWARAYGLNNHLVLGYSMAHLHIPERAEKLIADVFEAYIGGVIVSNPEGRKLVEEFLDSLVRPKLEDFKSQLKMTPKLDMMSAAQLNDTAFRMRKKATFTFVDSGVNGAVNRWEAVCSLDGVEAGRAKGRNQQEAKQRVASVVLQILQQGEESEHGPG
jgi:dsRNA-specific ribonuclease